MRFSEDPGGMYGVLPLVRPVAWTQTSGWLVSKSIVKASLTLPLFQISQFRVLASSPPLNTSAVKSRFSTSTRFVTGTVRRILTLDW